MIKQRGEIGSGIVGLSLLLTAQVVVASDYLSVESAQRQFFPLAQRFDEVQLSLTSEQKRAIAGLAGPQPPHGKFHVWRAMLGDDVQGYVFFDEVIGRQDFITYAVAIDNAGKLSAIEVLSYRESHGAEIRNAAWRSQFAGRQNLSQLRFSADIKNISGATLSSEHVTQGVRWLVSLWQTVIKAPGSDAR